MFLDKTWKTTSAVRRGGIKPSELILIVFCTIAFSSACAESRKTVAETETPEQVLQDLKKMQVSLVAAVQRKDTDALAQLWADEYIGTAPNGRVVTRNDLMSAVKGGAINLEALDIDDLRIRLFGDVAVLTGHAQVKATVNGEDYSGSYRGTGVYVKRDGRWQAVGVQVAPDKWTKQTATTEAVEE